jgi:hypothetical protein
MHAFIYKGEAEAQVEQPENEINVKEVGQYPALIPIFIHLSILQRVNFITLHIFLSGINANLEENKFTSQGEGVPAACRCKSHAISNHFIF